MIINWVDVDEEYIKLFTLLNTTIPKGYGATAELRNIMRETGLDIDAARRIMETLSSMDK